MHSPRYRHDKLGAERLRAKHEALIAQYKTVREHIATLAPDRNTNNKVFLQIALAILGVEGFILSDFIKSGQWPPSLLILSVCFVAATVGMVLSVTWLRTNQSYSIALWARYEMLRQMEKHLPAQPFTLEEEKRKERGYKPVASLISILATFFSMFFFAQLPAIAYIFFSVVGS
jgi:hypothetical protein